MSKRDDPYTHKLYAPPTPPPKSGGCAFCLLNLSLLLAAPTAVVALLVKGVRR